VAQARDDLAATGTEQLELAIGGVMDVPDPAELLAAAGTEALLGRAQRLELIARIIPA